MSDGIDEGLWGYLVPVHPAFERVNFSREYRIYTVGRDPGVNNVAFVDPRISRRHCAFIWDGTDLDFGVLVTDRSTNGTFINGERMDRGRTRLLKDGDEIAFGMRLPQHDSDDFRFTYRHMSGLTPTAGLYSYYDLGAELGRGTSGIVRKAVHIKTGCWVAVKMIPAPRTTFVAAGASRNTTLEREVAIMKQISHKHICELVETYVQSDGSINIVLELINGGHLSAYLEKTTSGIAEPVAKDIASQICGAVSYLHAKGITHRDLKLENILLAQDNPPFIKIADFGLAKRVDAESTSLQTFCGTPAYLAPEVLLEDSGVGYNHLVDSWSVGVVIFVMLTKEHPFRYKAAQGSLKSQIRERDIDWAPLENLDLNLSACAKSFVRELLCENPRDRMSLSAAMEHQWIA